MSRCQGARGRCAGRVAVEGACTWEPKTGTEIEKPHRGCGERGGVIEE